MDGKIIVAYKRYDFNRDLDHPICNGTQGGNIEFFDPSAVPADIQQLSQAAMEGFGLAIGGVDIIIDEQGRPYILEVNPEPDFTIGCNEFPDAIANYLKKLCHEPVSDEARVEDY